MHHVMKNLTHLHVKKFKFICDFILNKILLIIIIFKLLLLFFSLENKNKISCAFGKM